MSKAENEFTPTPTVWLIDRAPREKLLAFETVTAGYTLWRQLNAEKAYRRELGDGSDAWYAAVGNLYDLEESIGVAMTEMDASDGFEVDHKIQFALDSMDDGDTINGFEFDLLRSAARDACRLARQVQVLPNPNA